MHRLNSERGQRGYGHSSVGTVKALSLASVRQPWVSSQNYKGVCQRRLGLLVMTRQDNQGVVRSKFPSLALRSLVPFFTLPSNACISAATANGWNRRTKDVKIFLISDRARLCHSWSLCSLNHFALMAQSAVSQGQIHQFPQPAKSNQQENPGNASIAGFSTLATNVIWHFSNCPSLQGESQQERHPTRKLGSLSWRPAVQVGLAELWRHL